MEIGLSKNGLKKLTTALAIGGIVGTAVDHALASPNVPENNPQNNSIVSTDGGIIQSSNSRLAELRVRIRTEQEQDAEDIKVISPVSVTDREREGIMRLIPEENINDDLARVVEDGQLFIEAGSEFERSITNLNGTKRWIQSLGGDADMLILVGHETDGGLKFAPILNVSESFISQDGENDILFETDTVVLDDLSYLIPDKHVGNGKAEVIRTTPADVEELEKWFGDESGVAVGDWILAQLDREGRLFRLAGNGMAYEWLSQKVTARDQEANVRATPTTEAPSIGKVTAEEGLERVQATPENLEMLKARGLNAVQDGYFAKVEGTDGSEWYVVEMAEGEIGLIRNDVAVLGELRGSGPVIGKAEAPAGNLASVDLNEDLSHMLGTDQAVRMGRALGVADRAGVVFDQLETGRSAFDVWGKILDYGARSYEVQDIFDADRKYLVNAYSLQVAIPSEHRNFIVTLRAFEKIDVIDTGTGEVRNVVDYTSTPGIVSLKQLPDESVRGWSPSEGFESLHDYTNQGGEFIGLDLVKPFTPEEAAQALEQYSGKRCDQFELCSFVLSDMSVSDSETEFVNDYRSSSSDEVHEPAFYILPTSTIRLVFPPDSNIDINRGQ